MLVTAHVIVPPEQRGAYLATMAALAERLEARGAHCWVFERRDLPGAFVEFVEGDGAMAPRGHGGDPAEAALEAHLASLARYREPRHETWDAVSLTSPSRS
jgi:hypothetical protein